MQARALVFRICLLRAKYKHLLDTQAKRKAADVVGLLQMLITFPPVAIRYGTAERFKLECI